MKDRAEKNLTAKEKRRNSGKPLKKSKKTKKHRPARAYRDRVFRMLFREKDRLLELYNAVSGTHYADPEALTVNTLENAVYLGMKNDISFLIGTELNLYEHQSTKNANMPLRCLFYVTDLYSGLVNQDRLYRSAPIELPAPRFIVFYNGNEDLPDRMELRLSQSFAGRKDTRLKGQSGQPERLDDHPNEQREKPAPGPSKPDMQDEQIGQLEGQSGQPKGLDAQIEEPWLELKVLVININPGHNRELIEKCRTLYEYITFTSRVRENRRAMDLETAVEKAVDDCIRDGILAEFLTKNRSEVIRLSIYEFDGERFIQVQREEAKEEGLTQGLALGRSEGLAMGRSEGLALGRSEGIELIVRRLLERQSFSDEEILSISGLSKEDLQCIKNKQPKKSAAVS